ncbi:MAG TPA: hypothetical protein VGK83_09485 [Acidimicrobiia bacterium]
MPKARVWEPAGSLPAREWRQRLIDSSAEVGAVLEPSQGELLPALLSQLGGADLICAHLPVSDALKLVVEGLVVDSVNRDNVVELRTPFAFRIRSALAVIETLDSDQPVDLLETLATSLDALPFSPPAGKRGGGRPPA